VRPAARRAVGHLGKEAMTKRVHSTRGRRAGRFVVLAVAAAAITGIVVASSSASARRATASSTPTVYMIGSGTNNTFWAAGKNGWVQGGKDFGLHAIYEAPGVHSSAGSIPLITSAIAAKPAGMSINYTDKSIEKPTLDALNAGIAVTLFNNNRFEPVNGKASTATVDPRITKLAYVGEDSYGNAQNLAKAFLPFITKKSGT